MNVTIMTDPFSDYQKEVERYIQTQQWQHIDELHGQNFLVLPLAKGEYNLNYLLKGTQRDLVFRVNMASQIGRKDQIIYEFKALQLLQTSGVTPIPFYVDDSRTLIDRGISIMEYLPGRSLDYKQDLRYAARLFSIIHQLPVSESDNHLIREVQPLSLIVTECKKLLASYFQSELADREIQSFLREIIDWADDYKKKERYFLTDPWFCIVNTEVNSSNFIVNSEKKTTHLIDWEMARWGDPSTDLCHFCSPLTTLWKTDHRFSQNDSANFLQEYKRAIHSRPLRETLEERMQLKFPFVLLRGISWSAMGWIAYQTNYNGMRDNHTWQTLQRYMNINFIRSLFSPFMQS